MPVHRNRLVTPRGPRLARKTQRTEGCWLFTGFLNAQGYGVLRTGRRPGRLQLAHRVAWEEAFGPIPTGMLVCHTCDVRHCVRPDHLFVGSVADNNRDCNDKGRRNPQRGSGVGTAHLTEADIPAIRDRAAKGETLASIGSDYGMTKEGIHLIVKRINWKHVA